MPEVRSHERVDAWDPHVPGVREVFHAAFVDHAYPPHTHDAWTVLLVDHGVVRFALDRHEHGTVHSTVTVLPPHVAHDGRAATTAGFRKRVLYLDPAALSDHLVGPAVDRPTIQDRKLVRSLGALHGSLRRPPDPLDAEARVALVAERLAAHLSGAVDELAGLDDRARHGGRVPTAAHGPGRDPVVDLRDLLDADPAASPTLRDLAAEVGASPTHLVRSFSARFGVPPHAYLVGRRIELARRLLLDGATPAHAAAAAGFHDQAHLTRHFRRHVGTTPGRYRARAGRFTHR